MNGYIKLHRSMLDWEWMDDPVTVQVFIYCLLRANYDTNRWHGMIVKPGEFVTSLGHMAKELKISRQNLKTALLHLKSTHELTTKSTNKYTVISIEKWAEYQSAGEKVTHKVTHKVTSNQPTTNQQLTTDKEIKEIKERKEDTNRENNNIEPAGGVFEGAWFHEKQRLSADETGDLLQTAHGQYMNIKEEIMK